MSRSDRLHRIIQRPFYRYSAAPGRKFGHWGTEFEQSTMETIRLKLIKVGARVRATARKLWVHCPTGWIPLQVHPAKPLLPPLRRLKTHWLNGF